MPLPALPADKANHALYGATTYVLVGALAAYFGLAGDPRLWALGGVALVGAGKEVYDYMRRRDEQTAGVSVRHHVEGGDFLATVFGGVLVWLGTLATEVGAP